MKLGWLIAKEMLALPEQRGEGYSLFKLSVSTFSESTEPTLRTRTKHKQKQLTG